MKPTYGVSAYNFCDALSSTYTETKELHGRVLTFIGAVDQPVVNRRARRYLYFRYCLAVIHALQRARSRDKFPLGEIWATPSKPCGYLRKSCLRYLAMCIGDQGLPSDLIGAGAFEDTFTATGNQADGHNAEYSLSRLEQQVQERRPRVRGGEDVDEGEDEPIF